MKAKTLVTVLVIMTALTGVTFARGAGEDDNAPPYGPGRGWARSEDWTRPEVAEELTTVTGQVSFQDEFHPVLKSDKEEYELLVPRWAAYDLDIEEGETITVEGYLAEGMPCYDDEADEAHLLVTKAVVDGKEYEVNQGYGYGSMMGYGYGMMGPRGRFGGPHAMWGPGDRDWGRGSRPPRWR